MKNTSEQILSFAENELIDKESIRRAVLSEKPERQKKPVAWTKILLPIAACLALVCGTVLLIPSARAEVFSWFRSNTSSETISDYLSANDNEREAIPEFDPLVSSPNPDENEAVTIPLDRTDSEAVNSEKAMEVSAFLHENCDIELGDAMFDGENLYQSIRFNGLSGLYLLEPWVGGLETAVPVDPEKMTGMYDPSILEEYLSGEKTLYEQPNGWIFYEMPDGSRHGGSLDLTAAIEPYIRSLLADGLIDGVNPLSEQQQNELNERNAAYLRQNGVVAVAQIVPFSEDFAHYWDRFTDADGNMTVKVLYDVRVIEEDRADAPHVPDTELFSAELGTITVNMTAYQTLDQRGFAAADDAAFVWGPESVLLSRTTLDSDGLDRFTVYEAPMEGVQIRLDATDATIDALGIRNIKIRITVPDSWSEDEREALFQSLQFNVLLNGESGDWGPYASLNTLEDGTVEWTVTEIWNVPQEMLSSIETVSFFPYIHTVTEWIEQDASGNTIREIDPPLGETVSVNMNDGIWVGRDTMTEYPQYTITLHVN
ncbi:MAG: hypothetical protein IJK54_02610 [Clostridia bacterium]|nr:hypothetical protein [Clostridia bacterium]